MSQCHIMLVSGALLWKTFRWRSFTTVQDELSPQSCVTQLRNRRVLFRNVHTNLTKTIFKRETLQWSSTNTTITIGLHNNNNNNQMVILNQNIEWLINWNKGLYELMIYKHFWKIIICENYSWIHKHDCECFIRFFGFTISCMQRFEVASHYVNNLVLLI